MVEEAQTKGEKKREIWQDQLALPPCSSTTANPTPNLKPLTPTPQPRKIKKKLEEKKSRYALKDLDPDFMSLGRGHLDVLDREGFACAR
jgi:hypothetical protein